MMTQEDLNPNQGSELKNEPEEVVDRGRVVDASAATPEDERVAAMLEHTIDVPVLAGAVELQEPADAADTLEDLEEEEAADVLEQMDDQAAAEALAEMQTPLAIGVIEDLLSESKEKYAGRLIELMAPDDGADLLQSMDDVERNLVLGTMLREPAEELVQLIAYHRESAGGIMTTDFLSLHEDMTIEQAIEYIRSIEVPEDTQVALVTDTEDRLVGILGLHTLLLARKAERVSDVMNADVEAIKPDLDREAVARTFDRYDFSTLPVVDEDDCLLGLITVDDVIDIIREEQTEDVQKTVGAGKGEAVYSSLIEKFRGRILWLCVSLIMTCIAASIVLLGEPLLDTYRLLPFLLVVIAPLVGNAGHQALAVSLRGIVLDEVRRDRVLPLLIREGVVGILMGCALGLMILAVVVGLSSFRDDASWEIGAIAALAMVVSMGVGTVVGSAVPLLMKRFGADPAQSSAIFLIIITDGLAFISLLSLAYVALPHATP